MPREPENRLIDILHIGKVDSSYDRVWDQLQREGRAVEFARTQAAGMRMAWELQPRIVIVNTANSSFTGDRLCRTLGRRLPGAQRLLITERGAGTNIPCELRLARPFTARKLREALLKLLEASAPHVVEAGPLRLDLVSRVVTGPKGHSHLTPKQCNLLAAFMRHPNQVLSRRDLMERIWLTDYLGDTRTLDVHVRWLREKIENEPTHPTLLVTRRGVGYLLAVPGSPQPSPANGGDRQPAPASA